MSVITTTFLSGANCSSMQNVNLVERYCIISVKLLFYLNENTSEANEDIMIEISDSRVRYIHFIEGLNFNNFMNKMYIYF